MGFKARQIGQIFVGFCLFLGVSSQHILTPTYFNVAEGKEIYATATCGEGFAPPGERYCKLTGNTADVIRPGEQEIIQGQYCDYCDENDPVKYHPINQAIDGTEKWWQSPPLSRSTAVNYNDVNVTIDLGQLYHIAYIIIKSANSPRPGRFILERSTDYGRTYRPWQYFAGSDSECLNAYGMKSISDITNDDDVICTAEYSNIVPLEDGEIVVSLVNGRPGSVNFSYSETLQEWTKATNIRLRLQRTNTLLGHLMGLARQDPTVTRRYYYSIKDISIGGRCVCNGHADTCDTPGLDGRLICTCSHNTCGTECEYCCPGFVQKKWKQATLESSNECEPCNCHGHTSECYYDEQVARERLSLDIHGRYEGGGVCVDCQHNTTGVNCERCMDGYYREGSQPLDSPFVCQPCDCDPYFSTGNCAPITGQCECRPQFAGANCDECSAGYYDFPSCKPCDCNVNGTADETCQANGGQCPCKPNYFGQNCDLCAPGYYNFPECIPCDCNRYGSLSPVCHPDTGECRCRNTYESRTCGECQMGFFNFPRCEACSCSPYGVTNDVCNKTDGSCICKDNFGNLDCGGCDRGYYNFPFCLECNCDEDGSLYESCTDSGQCYCRNGFAGQKCNECDSGYFRYPDCLACNCSRDGSLSLLCDDFSGECTCRRGYQSRTCEMCEEGFYNYPNCEECNCNPAGVIDIPGEPLGGCGQATQGACRCKDNVIGRTCDSCSPRYFNLVRSNPAGCEACDCFLDGTIGGLAICDMSSGQCLCKAAVDGRRCEVCKDGYYRLRGDNAFGCVECGCDIGGSIHGICDKETGQCICRPRVTGRTCKEPAQLHFFPSLHQIKFEIESGYTPDGGRPRIGFDPDVFPGFSYLGYAVMSNIQPEVLVDITVDRTSIYRIVIRYMFEGGTPEKGRITVTPSSDRHGSEQTSDILFIPGPDPQFVTVEGGGIVMPFVLNPGEWTIKIMSPEGTLLDYLVLLPSAFYEASVLIENVADPCVVGQEQDSCNYYVYPSLDTFPNARGVDGYYFDINTNQQIEIRQFLDEYIMDEIDVMDIAHLDEDQSNLYLTIPFDKRGDYVFIVEYYGGDSDSARASFEVLGQDQSTTGFVNFYNCSYLCRSIVINADGEVQVFTIEEESLTVSLTQIGQPFFLGVSAIIAIPVSDFSYEFITPTLQCIKSSTGECIGSTFPFLPDASVIDLDDPTGEAPNPPNFFNPSTTFRYISAPDGPTTVIVHIRLPPPGRYVFVVHYYQPYSSGFEVDFKIPGEVNSEGSFNAKYCPHVSGCRVTVTLPDGTNVFDLTGKGQSSEITIPGGKNHQLWIDYILAIPEDQFSEDILNSIPEDRAGDFITYCANNEYYIGMDAPEICQEGVFSISTEFNNGAQYCDCDTSGSLSLTCERIGGQCPCRDNIIGRRCDRCSIGYYSFPLCRPCNCPNNICNEETGECICPENVVGANCDQCRPGTYGYDALAGCIECECDERGIETNTDDVCNVVTGQCRCKANVGGRRCDQCEDGHYQYPFCLECDCDPAGTIAQICDQTTSQCLCKDNVVGDRCDQCAIGSFNLDEENSQGCISCFCFGVTEDCRSYTRNRADIGFRQEWQVTNLEDARIRYNGELVNVYVHGRGTDPALPIYWIPPTNWLGSKLTSYGGYLTYRVHNNPLLTEPYQPLRRPDDVTITGNGIKITYTNVEQPLPSRSLSVSIKMVEDNFHYTGSSRKVSRVDFLMVLADVDDFRIRAQYFDNILDASLSEVMFDVTRKDGEGEKASSVERCRCPPEYMGTSCEQCAPGHYRINRGTFLGQCVPCQCNNHSNECDPETGTCENCQDNTEGAQCQKCRSGYHGNGTNGDTCEMCACPRAEENQNFAETCEYTITDDLICNCIEGHIGQYCERCGEGYYGDPSRPYGFCRRCDCSGNTDTSLPGPECDSLYGNCLKCHSDTTGENCEHCADWYYGDAKYLKNCQTCDCDRLGSESCNRTTGECHCKPNVVGERCDQCAAFHYDFESGNGCTACGCAVASVSFQCDLVTGVCDCQNGVEGDKCDKCTDGFFGYTQFGCDSCRCPPKLRCDPENGECICPPGATGPLCDQCEDRFVLTDEGCLPCDDCVHELLDILDEMDFTMNSNNSYEFNVSVSTNQVERLQEINQTMHVVKNKTGVYELNNQNMGRKLMNSTEDLDALKDLARKILKQGSKTDMNAREMAETANATLDAARAVADKLRETMEFIQAQANLKPTGSNESLNIADMLAQARGILEEIRARNHSQHKIDADMEHEAASELLQRALSLHNASQDLLGHVRNVSEDLDGFTEKVNELKNLTSVAGENVKQASAALGKNFTSAVAEAKRDIKQLYSQAQEENDQALDLIELADAFLEDAKAAVQVTAANASTLDAANNKMDNQLANLESAYNSTKDVVSDSEKHAANLTEQADLLEGLLVSTKESADNALQAANAYSNIVAAIEDAEKAALNAMNASSLARQEADLFGTQPADSLKQSNKLVTKGQKANKKLQDLEDDLTNAAESVNEAMGKLDDVQSDLSEIERGMMAIPSASSECDIRVCGERDDSCRPGFTGDNCNVAALSEEALEAKMQAMDASMRAEMAAFTVSQISGELDYLHDLVTVTIPDYIDETNIEAAQAQAQVTQGREIMASFQDLEQTLHDQHTSILNISKNVLGSLDELREMIGYARTLAQGIQVAAKLESDSILQLRAPVVEEQPQSVTSISMYFQTKEPNSLLFYGAAPDPSNGYVAIELVDGEAVFKFNLGDSYVELPLGINVADGQWHQLVAERNGKYGQLTIYSSGREKQEATIKSPGVLSLLKFADDFGLFVGGLFDNYTAPDTVNINPFVGGIDDVRFNQAPLGIWNFANAANVDEGILRNATDLSEVPDPDDVGSTLFDGNGFVKIANPSAVGAVFTHTISFKTLAPEGLIMFARKGSDFLSLELEGGKIVLRVSIDGETRTLRTSKKYNNNKWTLVYISNFAALSMEVGQTGRDQEVLTDEFETTEDINPMKYLYYGGLVGIPDDQYQAVTRRGFLGCMKGILVIRDAVNLNKGMRSKGIFPNCIAQDTRLVSFPAPYGGFVRLQPTDFYEAAELSLNFRALRSSGLIAYFSDDNHVNVMALQLVNGSVEAVFGREGDEITRLVSNLDSYDNGEWHSVSVSKVNSREVSLVVDDVDQDFGIFRTRTNVVADGLLFIGGLPSTIVYNDKAITSLHPFVGCISNVAVGVELKNFANRLTDLSANYNICPDVAEIISEPHPEIPTTRQYATTTEGISEECKLGLLMSSAADPMDAGAGFFGATNESRYEYQGLGREYITDDEMTFGLKTAAEFGVLYYNSDSREFDFTTLYLFGGKLVYSFNYGSGDVEIESSIYVNDNQWHQVKTVRSGSQGTIFVDDVKVGEGQLTGSSRYLSVETPLYVGGLPGDWRALDLPPESRISLIGCIKDFTVIPPRAFLSEYEVAQCRGSREPGVFFGQFGGYLVLDNSFSVGVTMEVSLEIKPRKNTGTIFSVQKEAMDFMSLEMRSGELFLTIENGRGEFTATFSPDGGIFSLCDGEWHSVTVMKSGNVAYIEVDGVRGIVAEGNPRSSEANTNDPLYFGGIPINMIHDGIVENENYVGCMRKVMINGIRQDISSKRFVGDVDQRSCPAN